MRVVRFVSRNKFRIIVAAFLLCSVTVGGALLSTQQASADVCSPNGRDCGHGYFFNGGPQVHGHNLYYGPGYLERPGPGLQANNWTDLVSLIGVRMACTNNATPGATVLPNPNDQNATSAAFTVLTMLGAAPGTPKNKACDRYREWTNLTKQYDQLGLIHYNEMYDSKGINTLYSDPLVDVVYYQDEVISASIVVYNPNGTGPMYAIKRDCGNPIGQLKGLPPIVGTPSCGGYTITPGLIDPQTAYNIKASVVYNSTQAATLVRTAIGTQFYLKVTGPGVNYNDPQVLPVTQSGPSINISVNMPPTGNTGVYTVSWGITGPYGPINCGGDGTVHGPGGPINPPTTFDVADQPYFDVNGGDVSAGGGMSAGGVDCAVGANTKAGIVSWNRGASGSYGGAGTKYAALALNHLQDFATGQGTGYAPSGMAFANTSDGQVNTGSGLFGGMFDSLPCVEDYYSTQPSGAKNLATLSHGTDAYKATGPVSLSAQTLNAKDHWTIYVDGDLYITGNISYGGSGSYATVADIPSFKVFVRGSIFIAPGVTQLDGMYVAQPTTAASGDGNIYTCATNVGSPAAHPYKAAPLNGSLYNTCKTNLTVNGAFIANQVWLLRTAGTISGSPAETFNFSPELWVSAPYDSSVSGSTSRKYDAITSLPPVL